MVRVLKLRMKVSRQRGRDCYNLRPDGEGTETYGYRHSRANR